LRGKPQNIALAIEHRLPGVDHNELSVGSPEGKVKPDLLGLAVCGGDSCHEAVGLGQRETGVPIRVRELNRDVMDRLVREDDRVVGKRSDDVEGKVAELAGLECEVTCFGAFDVLGAAGPRCRASSDGSKLPRQARTAGISQPAASSPPLWTASQRPHRADGPF
jgi:hypothetical protein